jgi:SAM-dependent methyltransferase
LAPGLIGLARAKAQSRGLRQARFIVGDFEELAEPDESFDAVVCVFGIFFLPDMPGAVRRLWRFVRPGGRLAITTWGPRVFEPANTIFWEAVRTLRPELYKGFNPWDRISTPDAVVALLAEGGVPGARAEAAPGWHLLTSTEDWWRIVMGSGYRGIIEQLAPPEQTWLRGTVLAEVAARHIDRIEANVIYAQAEKPKGH